MTHRPRRPAAAADDPDRWVAGNSRITNASERQPGPVYDRILVPTDGSASAEAAMVEAVALAEQFDAEVHVLHVIDDWRYDTTIESAVLPLREEGETYVERCVTTATDAGVAVQSEIELGRPARTILQYVDVNDVDLVVMGTRGHAGLPKRLLGSVTDYVVTHAGVPVHVVPAAD